jgi:hypothetical protein
VIAGFIAHPPFARFTTMGVYTFDPEVKSMYTDDAVPVEPTVSFNVQLMA